MQVFKLFLKIIKKNIFLFILYLGIFSLITVFMIQGQSQSKEYGETKVTAYILVEEENKESLEFVDYIKKQVQPIELKAGISVEDALFWDDIDLYFYIPKDFYDKILNEEEGIQVKASPDSIEAMSVLRKSPPILIP